MSKPWFLEMTMAAEPSELAARIEKVLKPMSSELAKKDGDFVAERISEKMQSAM